MDKPREGYRQKKQLRNALLAILGVAVIAGLFMAARQLKPAAMSVDAAPLWMDTVKQGPMVRNVRGIGTLVPEQILMLPAATTGRVERIIHRPGDKVSSDTVILVLSNPELSQQMVDAEFAVKAAQARLESLRVQLQSEELKQKSEIARLDSEVVQAGLQADRDESLFREKLLSDLTRRLSRAKADELGKRLELEKERLVIQRDSTGAQMMGQKAEIEKVAAMLRLKQQQLAALNIRAGSAGVVQEVPVQEGQSVIAGALLARVAQPGSLKAVLKVPETQAKDVQPGQKADIDTRNGIIAARIARIDPAAKEGSVVVEARLEGPLPDGARPDLNVDGVIEIERLASVVYVGRPAVASPGQTTTLFRVSADGKEAARVKVMLGRSAVNTIEVRDGLRPGDKVILSDIPQAENVDRIRLQ
jgi:HlyD family secretion protein